MRVLRLLSAAVLGFAPATLPAQIVVTSSAVVERAAAPGESWSGTIGLRNPTDRPYEARVYLTDYGFSADGATRYSAPGTTPRSSAGWTVVSPSRVTVPAGGQASVAYTVSVPRGAALSGTYWSMVMVETAAPEPPAGAAARRDARVQVGVRTAMRYGVQLSTTVRGTGTPRAAFASPRAAVHGGRRTLGFDVVNDGEVAYRPRLRLELFDGEGNPRGRWEAARGLMYPGTSVRQSFDLGALPAGRYQAMVVADAGGESVFGARYTLTL
jgi:hypothetical protein